MPDNALAVADDPLAKGRDDPLEASMIEQFKTGQQEQAGARQALQSKIEPQIQGLKKDIAGIKDVGSRPPVDRPTPEPPNPQVAMQEAGTWIAAAIVMGALAGAMTRRGTTNSIAAFTGALEGFKEGNQQKFQQNYQYWEAQQKKISADNKAQWDKYQAILDNKKLDITLKMNMISLEAKQGRDDIADQAAARQDYITFAGLIDQRRKAQEQMDMSRERIATTIRGQNMRYGQAGDDDTRAQAIAAGKEAPPSPNSPRYDALMNKVRAINPKFEASTFPAGLAGDKSVAVRSANLENIMRSVNSIVPQALDASAALARTRWVPVNTAIQLAQSAKSTPELEAFATVNMNLAELWARSQKPTGVLDVELQKMALGRLSTAKSDQAYRTIVNQIVESIGREQQAVRSQQNKEPMQRPDVPGAFVPPKGGGAPSGGAQLPPGWSIEEIK